VVSASFQRPQNVPDTVCVVPPDVYVTLYVSPEVGCAVPVPLNCIANRRPVAAGSVCPAFSVNVYVIALDVLEFDCVICPPTVL
jgi:hypothetical protein